jgi:hypothetical protein
VQKLPGDAVALLQEEQAYKPSPYPPDTQTNFRKSGKPRIALTD